MREREKVVTGNDWLFYLDTLRYLEMVTRYFYRRREAANGCVSIYNHEIIVLMVLSRWEFNLILVTSSNF